MQPPIIGISTYVEQAQFGVWDRVCALLPETYVHQVRLAGAVPVLLPPADDAAAVMPMLDGLILAGGPDVDPARYGARRHPLTDEPRVDRDQWELQLIAAAWEAGLPLLGICRGMQLLNVAAGGDLVQALEDQTDIGLHRKAVGAFGRHPVEVVAGSWCAQILGTSADVASHHHQAVRTVGHGLHPVAWAADGCIEALEGDGEPLLLGVQWHPEEELRSVLIENFIQACVGVRAGVIGA